VDDSRSAKDGQFFCPIHLARAFQPIGSTAVRRLRLASAKLICSIQSLGWSPARNPCGNGSNLFFPTFQQCPYSQSRREILTFKLLFFLPWVPCNRLLKIAPMMGPIPARVDSL
jgi:hypothetical protein